MPKSHGKERQRAKQKKRRQERQKVRAARPLRQLAAESVADYRVSCGYDANHPPSSELWSALDERDKLDRVARYHTAALDPSRHPPSMQRHAGMHVGVENQLASGKPPQVAEALARLIRDGMNRHDALHAVGWVMTEHMKRAVESRRPIDNDAYLHDLEQLSLQRWLEMAGVKR